MEWTHVSYTPRGRLYAVGYFTATSPVPPPAKITAGRSVGDLTRAAMKQLSLRSSCSIASLVVLGKTSKYSRNSRIFLGFYVWRPLEHTHKPSRHQFVGCLSVSAAQISIVILSQPIKVVLNSAIVGTLNRGRFGPNWVVRLEPTVSRMTWNAKKK